MYAQYVSKLFGNQFFCRNWQELLCQIENLKPNEGLIITPYERGNIQESEELFSICCASNELYVCFLYNGEEYYAINPLCNINELWDVYMGHNTVRHSKYFLTQIDAIQITQIYCEQGIMHPAFKWSDDIELPKNL